MTAPTPTPTATNCLPQPVFPRLPPAPCSQTKSPQISADVVLVDTAGLIMRWHAAGGRHLGSRHPFESHQHYSLSRCTLHCPLNFLLVCCPGKCSSPSNAQVSAGRGPQASERVTAPVPASTASIQQKRQACCRFGRAPITHHRLPTSGAPPPWNAPPLAQPVPAAEWQHIARTPRLWHSNAIMYPGCAAGRTSHGSVLCSPTFW
jgi:hypothetical protein